MFVTTDVSTSPSDFNNFFVDSIREIKDEIVLNKDPRQNEVLGYMENLNLPKIEFKWRPVTRDNVLLAVSRLSSSNSRDVYNISIVIAAFPLKQFWTLICLILVCCLSTGFIYRQS